MADDKPLVRLRRRGGSPPPDWEMLVIRVSGDYALWRTVMRPSAGGGRIGRFAGKLPAAAFEKLERALSGCTGKTGSDGPPPPDSSIDRFLCESGELTIPSDAAPPPAWREAAEQLRGFLDSLTAHPVAAIGIEGSPDGARLIHLGTEALELDLSAGSVRVVSWKGDAIAGEWSAPLAGPRTEKAAPGWSLALPSAPDLAKDGRITVSAEGFLAFDGDFWRACGVRLAIEGG